MMNVAQLLRVDTQPSKSEHGVCFIEFTDSDRFVGMTDDGEPIIEKGDTYRQWGYERGYATKRMRFLRLLGRLHVPRRWVWGR